LYPLDDAGRWNTAMFGSEIAAFGCRISSFAMFVAVTDLS
jgi:hypothetical protein